MTSYWAPWARALAYALHGFALFGVLAFGALLLGVPALPVLAALIGLLLLTRGLLKRDRLGLGVLVAVAAQGVALGGIYLATEIEQRRACDSGERRVLETFPHPGGAHPEVDGDINRDGCIARLHASGAPGGALAVYRRELRARGWRVQRTAGGEAAGLTGVLVATRNGRRFRVFWTDEGAATRLTVTVGD